MLTFLTKIRSFMRKYALFVLLIFVTGSAFAQVRSTVQPGAWNVGATWSGGVVPTSANSTSIVVGHNVNIPSGFNASLDQVTVNQGVTLTVDNGGTLTIVDDGTVAPDLTLFNNGIAFGFLQVSGIVVGSNGSTFSGTGTSNVTFLTGSTYRHAYTATEGSLPLATWNASSTVEITGYNTNITATASGNWGQSFGNFTYNCVGQPFTSTVDFAGLLTSIAGNFNVLATNSGPSSRGLITFSSGQSPTINIGGNFTLSGTSRFYASTSGSATVNVGGNVSITSTNTKGYGLTTGGTATMDITGSFSLDAVGGKFYLANGAGPATLLVDGDFSENDGLFLGTGDLQFTGSGTQTFTALTPFSTAINYLIGPSSTLDVGTNILAGSGSFTLQGAIRLGSTEATGAITNNTSAGNIRTPLATRVYQAGSRIIYGGGSAQFIGTGHPSTANVATRIDNAGGVTVASAVTIGGVLELTSGTLAVSNQTLTLAGTVVSVTGTMAVTTASSIVVTGTGALGALPFASGAQTIGNLTLNRTSSGSATLNNDLTVDGILTLTNGDLIFSNRLLTLRGTLSRTSGFLLANSSATLAIGGAGAFGSSVAFSPTGNTVGTLTINRPGTGNVLFASTLNVVTAVNLLTGSLVNTGSIFLANGATVTRASGNLNTNRFSNAPGDRYNLVYTGSGISTGLELPDPADAVDLNNITFNGGTITNTQNLAINGTALFSAGSFQGGLRIITMQGSNWTVNSGSFVPGTGTVIFNGTTTVGGSGAIAFNIITVNNGASLTFPADTVSVSSNFTINPTATFNSSFGNVRFNGTSGQNLSANGADFFNIIINKSVGNVTLTSAVDVIGRITIQTASTLATGNNLTLISTSDAATGNASIGALPSGAGVTGNVTVQRFMSMEGTINRYISSPVTNAPVSQLQDDFSVTGPFTGTSFPCAGCPNNNYSLKEYLEYMPGSFEAGYSGYPKGSNAQILQPGKGYLAYMWQSAQVTWDVTGPINQGTINYAITYSNSGSPNDDGWNLVGNPYPSSIVWDNGAGWTKNLIAPIVYVTDNNGPGSVFRSWNPNTLVGDIPGGRIATGQSFWVYASGAGASLSVNEQAKTTTGVFFRKRQADNVMISLNHQGMVDNAFVVIHPDATEGFDPDYDGMKLENPVFSVSIADREARKLAQYAVNELADRALIPLSVRTRESGTYTFSAGNVGSFSKGDHIYLIDKELNNVTHLTEAAQYSFTVEDPEREFLDRFYLTFSASGAEFSKEIMANRVNLFPNPTSGDLTIQIDLKNIQDVTMFNSAGAAIGNIPVPQATEFYNERVNIGYLPKGVYIVKVKVPGAVVIKKVVKN
jgi:Secretion system C-terminal sorting domain